MASAMRIEVMVSKPSVRHTLLARNGLAACRFVIISETPKGRVSKPLMSGRRARISFAGGFLSIGIRAWRNEAHTVAYEESTSATVGRSVTSA